MKELIKNIEQWAEERNLIEGSTPQKQMLKLIEEFGELCGGIAKNKPEVIKDSIGDCFVVLVILNLQHNWEVCFEDYKDKYVFQFIRTDLIPNGLNNLEIIRDICSLIPSLYGINIKPVFDDYRYAIWSIIVALEDLANIYDLSLTECIQNAYNQIKDRKGKMINGVFVKEEDL
ncbi:MazG-like family protein [Pasteurella caecimuris]|uniref:MazG-like family protein n=1 Tax=Rodentibacter caecimuris TaxID=1796644 RepID=UPI00214F6CAC|nr:MazG-like family protein [Pasteurella caecimuris]MCR1837594.1 MazG-like family protein [Pasteurella caecimuris]MCU0107980.1 MazG-like family protein [Pasteurella caecimuris]